MFKSILIFSLTLITIEAESLNSILTQKGGRDNAIFLNPAKLQKSNAIRVMESSISMSRESLLFLKDLKSATSSSTKNQDISELLKKNIGKTISFSAHNFSSLSQTNKNISWNIGIANSIDGYFITHTGFGSKGAMESLKEEYKALIGTITLQKEQINYGLNIKVMEKSQDRHNYSSKEMIENSSFSHYLYGDYTKKESAIGTDIGVLYTIPKDKLQTKLSLSLLDIGDTSFKNIETVPSTTNIGVNMIPYKHSFLQIDYLDIFNHQRDKKFKDSFRVHLSKLFPNQNLRLNTGIFHNALSYGFEYKLSILKIALNSYNGKTYHQKIERRYELSMGLSW